MIRNTGKQRTRNCLSAGLILTLLLATTAVVEGQLSRRPLILLVHGRGQTDSSETRTAWEKALRHGLSRVTDTVPIRPSDIAFVWYANVLTPGSPQRCDHHESNRRSQRMWYSRDKFQNLWIEARLRLAAITNAIPGGGASAVSRLPDVELFLTDLQKRCAVERRLAFALRDAARDGRPVILVTHSLGSLTAYSYLEEHNPRADYPPFDIPHVISFGSMLSVPEVYRAILGSMVKAPIPWPEQVGAWTNIRDPLDALAFPYNRLMSPDSVGVRRSLEIVIDTSPGPRGAHDAVHYLEHPTVAGAILSAWCDAYVSLGARRTPGCI